MSDREQNASADEAMDLTPERNSEDALEESTFSEGVTEEQFTSGEEYVADNSPFAEEAPPPTDDLHCTEEALPPADDLHLAEEDELEGDAGEPKVERQKKPAGTVSLAGLGFFFFLLTVVAAGGGGYAVLYVLGGSFQQLLELQPPLLYVLGGAAGGVLLLGLIGALAVSRAAAASKHRSELLENLLTKVTQLDLKEMEGWQDESFSTMPSLANNLLTIKYTYERLMNKHMRGVGLDGELLRLEKALVNAERVDMTAKYDHPAAGRLADETLRLWDERTQARTQWEEMTAKFKETGMPISQGMHDAALWNDMTNGDLQSQARVLTNLRTSVESLSQAAQKSRQSAQTDTGLVQLLANVQNELSRAVISGSNQAIVAGIAALRELVEREGKLAFQIAMVVAHLGRDGEPLLPLTQKLEALTGDFKQVAGKLDELSADHEGAAAVVNSVRKKLQDVQDQAGQNPQTDKAWHDVMVMIDSLVPQINQVLAVVNELPPQFTNQTERLNEIGSACAQLTGIDFEPVVLGENPAAAGEPEPGQSNIEVERFDPISTGGGADISAGGEPLAGMPAVPEAENHTVSTGDISLGPIAEPLLSNSQVEDPLVATDDTEQASLSAGEEKVYDLNDFDAIAVDSANAAVAAEDGRIYDLEEFGAVALS